MQKRLNATSYRAIRLCSHLFRSWKVRKSYQLAKTKNLQASTRNALKSMNIRYFKFTGFIGSDWRIHLWIGESQLCIGLKFIGGKILRRELETERGMYYLYIRDSESSEVAIAD